MTFPPRSFALALAAPLALALTACGKEAADPAAAASAPLPTVAAPAGTSWRDTVAETEAGGHLVGNPNAPIKLIEYGSLSCPACAAFARDGMEPLMAKYVESGRVSFELRNFAVHGGVDLVLARLARCSTKEAVIPLSDQIWHNLPEVMGPLQSNQAGVDRALNLPMAQRFNALAQVGGLYDFFASRGISADQARSCLADIPSLEKLAAETDRYTKQDEVTGTPTFMLNGRKLDGVNGWAALEPILQRAGAR
ncbi:MAG: thioredoxin domain-containing protein [Altererythrobacter sp.]|nr:thioredoxin domain-containing protein [Altererythrobacter sp.]